MTASTISKTQIWSVLATVVMVMGVWLVVSCRSYPGDEVQLRGSHSISTTGLELTTTISAQEIATSDMLDVRLRLRHDPAYDVQWAELSPKMGVFFVFESHTSSPKLDETGWVIMTRVITLEPDLSGVCMVPEMVVTAQNADGEDIQLSSKPITVTVVSVLTDGEKKLKDIAPDKRSVEPEPMSRWPLALLMANVLVVCCLIVVWRKWKKPRVKINRQTLKHFQELELASSTEVMLQLESAVSSLIAQQFDLKLRSVDFTGLSDRLTTQGITVSGLQEAIAAYESFQYTSTQPSDEEVEALYTGFKTLIESLQGKEAIA